MIFVHSVSKFIYYFLIIPGNNGSHFHITENVDKIVFTNSLTVPTKY